MPAPLVVMGAMISCSFGAAPMPLTVLPKGSPVMAEGMLVATIQDAIPVANIPPFVVCNSPSHPAQAAAKAAGSPLPCMPVTAAWTPGSSTVMVNGIPALNATSTCTCTIGAGTISVVMPGTTRETVP